MKSRFLSLLPVAAIFAAVALPMQATALGFGTYDLGSHPDGSLANPVYGLRLDNLYGSGDRYTFNFDHPSSNVTLDYDDNAGNRELRISGKMFGGADDGAAGGYLSGTTAIRDFEFTFDVGVEDGAFTTPPSESNVLVAVDAHRQNFGRIARLDGSGAEETFWDLRDDRGSKSHSFFIGTDHRGYAGLSGFGWLDTRMEGSTEWNNSGPGGTCCKDFLFTLNAVPGDPNVPEPATLGLAGLGLLGAGWIGRRRRAARIHRQALDHSAGGY